MIRVEWGRLVAAAAALIFVAVVGLRLYHLATLTVVGVQQPRQAHSAESTAEALSAADRQLFAAVDSDADGNVSLAEFSSAMKVQQAEVAGSSGAAAPGGLAVADITGLFAALDADQSGGLSLAEFAADGAQSSPSTATRQPIQAANAAAAAAAASLAAASRGDGAAPPEVADVVVAAAEFERALCADWAEMERVWRRRVAGREALLGSPQYRASSAYSSRATGWDAWEPEWTCPTDGGSLAALSAKLAPALHSSRRCRPHAAAAPKTCDTTMMMMTTTTIKIAAAAAAVNITGAK